MIHGYDLIAVMRNGLANDSTISAWAVTNYGRRQVVHVGWDHTADITEADCPLIALRPVSESGGMDAAFARVQVALTVALWESRVKSDAPAGTRVPECYWVERMHTLLGYAWTACRTAVDAGSKWPINTISVEYNDEAFPLVQAAAVLSLDAIQCLGASEPTLT